MHFYFLWSIYTGRLAQLLRHCYRCGSSGVRKSGRSSRKQSRQRLAFAATFFRNCVAQALSRGDGPRHQFYTLRRNTASIIKIGFLILNIYSPTFYSIKIPFSLSKCHLYYAHMSYRSCDFPRAHFLYFFLCVRRINYLSITILFFLLRKSFVAYYIDTQQP